MYDIFSFCEFVVYTCDGFYKYEDCSNSQYVKNCQRNNNVTVEKVYVKALILFIFNLSVCHSKM